jgi:hypothetical protein
MEDSHIVVIERIVSEFRKDVDGIRVIVSNANGMLEENNGHLSKLAIDVSDLKTKVDGIQKALRRESRREKRNREVQLTIALVSLVFAGLLGSLALGNPAYRILSPYSPMIGLIGASLLFAGGVYLIFWGGKGVLHYVESAK